ncbi:MAG: hypothetical protein ABI680_00360 [Chthoniobacteraceae bacterium]
MMSEGTSAFFEEQHPKSRRRLIVSVIIGAVILHVIAAIVAGIIIVARYFQPPPATFVVQRDIRLPAKEREHQMNMAAFAAMAPKPSFNDKLQSMRPTAFALPDLPKVPLDQMFPLDPSAIVSDQVNSMAGSAGLGAAGAGLSGLGGTGKGVTFLGVTTDARRILLMYDVSVTVANAAKRAGFPMARVREETEKLITGLGINVRFGMVEFARNYAFFRDELLPATDANRAAAREWLAEYFAVDGSMPRNVPDTVRGSPGFLEVLRKGFALRPDAIFIIADGDFQSGSGTTIQITTDEIEDTLDELQKALPKPATIHFIGVGMKSEHERGIRRAIARHGGGGKLTELKK